MNERETIRLLISSPPDHEELWGRLKVLLTRGEQEGFYLRELYELVDRWHDEAREWCVNLGTIIGRARTFTRGEKAEIGEFLVLSQGIYEQARLEIRAAVNREVVRNLCREDDDPSLPLHSG